MNTTLKTSNPSLPTSVNTLIAPSTHVPSPTLTPPTTMISSSGSSTTSSHSSSLTTMNLKDKEISSSGMTMVAMEESSGSLGYEDKTSIQSLTTSTSNTATTNGMTNTTNTNPPMIKKKSVKSCLNDDEKDSSLSPRRSSHGSEEEEGGLTTTNSNSGANTTTTTNSTTTKKGNKRSKEVTEETLLEKRRKNTEAARRSRMRKVLKILNLEKRVKLLENKNQQLTIYLSQQEQEKTALEQNYTNILNNYYGIQKKFEKARQFILENKYQLPSSLLDYFI